MRKLRRRFDRNLEQIYWRRPGNLLNRGNEIIRVCNRKGRCVVRVQPVPGCDGLEYLEPRVEATLGFEHNGFAVKSTTD